VAVRRVGGVRLFGPLAQAPIRLEPTRAMQAPRETHPTRRILPG